MAQTQNLFKLAGSVRLLHTLSAFKRIEMSKLELLHILRTIITSNRLNMIFDTILASLLLELLVALCIEPAYNNNISFIGLAKPSPVA